MMSNDIVHDDVWTHGHNDAKTLYLGIDLGTCNSCMAIWHPGKMRAKIIKSANDTRITPTTIKFGERFTNCEYGVDVQASKHVVAGFKPLIGASQGDPTYTMAEEQVRQFPYASDNLRVREDVLELECFDNHRSYKSMSPETLAALFLGYMKSSAEAYISRKPISEGAPNSIEGCVIGIPAQATQSQRKATVRAASEAGFKHVYLLIESTAAAVAYGLFVTGEKMVCVFDMGGGTTDVTIMHICDGKFTVRACTGSMIGGTHMDSAMCDLCFKKVNLTSDAITSEQRAQLLNDARKAKEQLTEEESVEVTITDHGTVTILRSEYEEVINDLLNTARACVSQLLDECGMNSRDIHEVICVGGATRTPAVKQMILSLFAETQDGKPRQLCTGVDADEAVAQGLAIRGAVLGGVSQGLLQDIFMIDLLPRSIGVLTAENEYDVILEKNIRIPGERFKDFMLENRLQKWLSLDIYEEDAASTDQALSISRVYTLDVVVPPSVQQRARLNANNDDDPIYVRVIFSIDDNGRLGFRVTDPQECSTVPLGDRTNEAATKAGSNDLNTLLCYLVVLILVYIFVCVYFKDEWIKHPVNQESEYDNTVVEIPEDEFEL